MKKVIVFVPITMYVKDDTSVDEVIKKLEVMDKIIAQSELESSPQISINSISYSDIIKLDNED